MTMISHVYHEGLNAVGVIDFNAAAEAAMAVVINGLTYLEADAADAANGVWTNGASDLTSAASLVAAINGDTRFNKNKITAVASAVGASVVVAANFAGVAGNYVVTQDGAGNCTVEDMHDGVDSARKRMAVVNYTVTAQDILADEVNIPLPFTPSAYKVEVRTVAGLTKAATFLVVVGSDPTRLFINFAGATDPVATDIIHATVFE